MGRQEGCPRYMQPTESSKLRGGVKPAKRDVKAKPRRPVAPRPRVVSEAPVAGARPVDRHAAGNGGVGKVADESKARHAALCLGRTSIPKAPMKAAVSQEPALPVSYPSPSASPVASPKRLSPVSSLKKAAARVLPGKMRVGRRDVSKRAVEKIRNSVTSRLPSFTKPAPRQKDQVKAVAPAQPLPRVVSKIPRPPMRCGMGELESNSGGLQKPRVMTRAEQRHYGMWERMAKTDQQAFGFGGASGLAAIRC